MAEIKSQAEVQSQIRALEAQKAKMNGIISKRSRFKLRLKPSINLLNKQIEELRAALANLPLPDVAVLTPEKQRIRQYIFDQKALMEENKGVLEEAIAEETEGTANMTMFTEGLDGCITIIGKLQSLYEATATSDDPSVQESKAQALIAEFDLDTILDGAFLSIDPSTGKLVNNGIDSAGGKIKEKLEPILKEVTGWEPVDLGSFDKTFTFPLPLPGVSGGISFKGSAGADWDFGSARPDYNGPIEQLGVKLSASLSGSISATGYIDAGFQAGPYKMFTVGAGIYGQLTIAGGPYVTLTIDAATGTKLTGKLGAAGDLSFEGGIALVLNCAVLKRVHLEEAVEYFSKNWFSGLTTAYQNELRFSLLKEQVAIISLGEVGLTLDLDAGFSFELANSGAYASIHPNLQAKLDSWTAKLKEGVEAALDTLNEVWKEYGGYVDGELSLPTSEDDVLDTALENTIDQLIPDLKPWWKFW